MKTVLCIGASRLYAYGAAMQLEEYSDGAIRAVACVPGNGHAIDVAADVALIDLPAARGAEFVHEIRIANPQVRVIAIVDPALQDDVLEYARKGVDGYLTTDRAPLDIVSALLNGEPSVAAPIQAILLREIAHLAPPETGPAAVVLTPREIQVLSLIEKGLSNKEIARMLRVQLTTVKNHVHQILAKTRARRRTQAVCLARTHFHHGASR